MRSLQRTVLHGVLRDKHVSRAASNGIDIEARHGIGIKFSRYQGIGINLSKYQSIGWQLDGTFLTLLLDNGNNSSTEFSIQTFFFRI